MHGVGGYSHKAEPRQRQCMHAWCNWVGEGPFCHFGQNYAYVVNGWSLSLRFILVIHVPIINMCLALVRPIKILIN